MPWTASCWKDIVEGGCPEAEILVMATCEPEPPAALVPEPPAPPPKIGGDVVVIPSGAVETPVEGTCRCCWVSGSGVGSLSLATVSVERF